jgi:hypothetical protein
MSNYVKCELINNQLYNNKISHQFSLDKNILDNDTPQYGPYNHDFTSTSTNQHTIPSTNPPTIPSTNIPTNLSTIPSTNPPIIPSTNTPTNLSTNQHTKPPCCSFSIHPTTVYTIPLINAELHIDPTSTMSDQTTSKQVQIYQEFTNINDSTKCDKSIPIPKKKSIDPDADLVIIYEHSEWQKPLFAALDDLGVQYSIFDLKWQL